MAGTGSNSTAEAIERTKHAEHVGAAASLQVCPYYNRPTQDGILALFEAIAKATKLHLFIYNIPSRTGRLKEFLAGTHPNDFQSKLTLSVRWIGAGLDLEFPASSNRTYSLLQNPAPASGNYNVLTNFPVHPTNRLATFHVEPSAQSRFFRVVTPALP